MENDLEDFAVNYNVKEWKHVFKLDPAKELLMNIWNKYVSREQTQSLLVERII